jgi:hypothetical protein
LLELAEVLSAAEPPPLPLQPFLAVAIVVVAP